MKVEKLCPLPEQKTEFAWPHCVSVPDQPGCYALTTYGGEVLYVGLASKSIRERMSAHLDSPSKRNGSDNRVPFWFYYRTCGAPEVAAVERGWMNQSILEDGSLPPLNVVYSPM